VIIRRLKDYRKDRPVIEENPARTAQVGNKKHTEVQTYAGNIKPLICA